MDFPWHVAPKPASTTEVPVDTTTLDFGEVWVWGVPFDLGEVLV